MIAATAFPEMLVGSREGAPLKRIIAIKGINLAGFLQRQELSERVSPQVLLCAGYVKESWGDESKQLMLIDGKRSNILAVGLISVAEPPGEGLIDPRHRLHVVAAREGSTRATGIVGDNHSEAPILSTAPESRLAQTGMPHDDGAFPVDVFQREQVIKHA